MHRPLDPNTGKPLPLKEDSVKPSKGAALPTIKEAKKPSAKGKKEEKTDA